MRARARARARVPAKKTRKSSKLLSCLGGGEHGDTRGKKLENLYPLFELFNTFSVSRFNCYPRVMQFSPLTWRSTDVLNRQCRSLLNVWTIYPRTHDGKQIEIIWLVSYRLSSSSSSALQRFETLPVKSFWICFECPLNRVSVYYNYPLVTR